MNRLTEQELLDGADAAINDFDAHHDQAGAAERLRERVHELITAAYLTPPTPPIGTKTTSKDEIIDELSIWAERYAIVRKSYANSSMARLFPKLIALDLLSTKTLAVLISDIEKELRDDSIPYDDQKKAWLYVVHKAKQKLHSRDGEYQGGAL